MYTVRKILENKGREVWSTSPDATVYEALQLMKEKDIGALPVIEDETLVGMFSERDYARKVILEGRSSHDTPVRAIMTENVITIHPDQTTEDCMALMTEKHIRHLPVSLGDDRMIGLISIGDVVKAVISNKEFVIEQLENYISGER